MKNSIIAKLFSALALFFVATGCSDNKTADTIAMERLDRAVAVYGNTDVPKRLAMIDSLGDYLAPYLNIVGVDTLCDSTMQMVSRSRMVEMFSPAVDSVFPNMDNCAAAIAGATARAADLNVTLPDYRYATVVWGKDKSVIVSDSIMFIALNHYLGPDHDAYSGWPDYMRVNKRPEMIPYDVVEARLALHCPFKADPQGNTLLSRMLYDGSLAYLKMQLIPDAAENMALGFSAEQLKDIAENESFMWNKLVNGKMLYSTDADLAAHLLGPAPASSPISPDAPGRAVRYIGYRIVKSYMENNDSQPLDALLSPGFYNDRNVLRKAAYNPK